MREGYVLFAGRFNEEYDPILVVPVAYIILLSETVRFFEKVHNGYEELLDFVLRNVKRCCPCVLIPFEGDWQFFLNAEGVALIRGYKIDYLPVIDLTTRC